MTHPEHDALLPCEENKALKADIILKALDYGESALLSMLGLAYTTYSETDGWGKTNDKTIQLNEVRRAIHERKQQLRTPAPPQGDARADDVDTETMAKWCENQVTLTGDTQLYAVARRLRALTRSVPSVQEPALWIEKDEYGDYVDYHWGKNKELAENKGAVVYPLYAAPTATQPPTASTATALGKGVDELQARIDAALKRLGDLKGVHTRWYDGREPDADKAATEMERIAFSVGCYLQGEAGPYRTDLKHPCQPERTALEGTNDGK